MGMALRTGKELRATKSKILSGQSEYSSFRSVGHYIFSYKYSILVRDPFHIFIRALAGCFSARVELHNFELAYVSFVIYAPLRAMVFVGRNTDGESKDAAPLSVRRGQ